MTDNAPQYEIVPAGWPLGYHPVGNMAHPQLACDRCAALVFPVQMETDRHDAWHAALGR